MSGKARTPWKGRLGSEETRHPTEDKAWVHEVAEGRPQYLKSIRWYSVCLQLSQTGVDLNQAIRVLGLSAAKSDWVWGTTRRGTGAQGSAGGRSVPERNGRGTKCVEVAEGCGSSQKCSMSYFSSLSENGTKTQGGAGWVRRVSGKARTSAEEEAWFRRGQASCGRQSMGPEGSGSAMEMQAAFWQWSEDCETELECTEECGKESE